MVLERGIGAEQVVAQPRREQAVSDGDGQPRREVDDLTSADAVGHDCPRTNPADGDYLNRVNPMKTWVFGVISQTHEVV